jgi:hypothetical protein
MFFQLSEIIILPYLIPLIRRHAAALRLPLLQLSPFSFQKQHNKRPKYRHRGDNANYDSGDCAAG